MKNLIEKRDCAQIIVLILGLLFSLMFALATPPFWGGDNMSHFARAYQISQGVVLPEAIEFEEKPDVGAYGGYLPEKMWSAYEESTRIEKRERGPREPRFAVTDHLKSILNSRIRANDSKVVVWFNNTALYSPVAYGAPALGFLVARMLNATVAGYIAIPIIFNLIFYITACWCSVWLLRRSKWRWLMVAWALFPPALAQSTIAVTADTSTNALLLLAAALFIKLFLTDDKLSTIETVILSLICLLVPLVKPTYVFIVIVFLFASKEHFGFNSRIAAVVKYLSVGVGVASWFCWNLISSPVSAGLPHFRKDYWTGSFGSSLQIEYILGHPIDFLKVIIRTFVIGESSFYDNVISSASIPASQTGMLCFFIALFIVCASVEVARFSQHGIAVLSYLMLAAAVAASIASIYLTFNPVGYPLVQGIHARYFYPVIPFLIIFVLEKCDFRLYNSSYLNGFDGENDIQRGEIFRIAVPLLLFSALLLTYVRYAGSIWIGTGGLTPVA
ncbi:DUF2142 domain-containing protein [Bifidobacterium parmae]|uniref:DUF2142 domain-containing protein n=1 Tax=Bifidobacterium parmae TaxID=361854 RepID=A0A2N5J3K7_9BIFI|nr:DUF2142 domain-containing protein [Bifidobacterium parmae]PLS28804.1 hypothetical protein Uis4E_1168 [Bifidobacterium parmae]